MDILTKLNINDDWNSFSLKVSNRVMSVSDLANLITSADLDSPLYLLNIINRFWEIIRNKLNISLDISDDIHDNLKQIYDELSNRNFNNNIPSPKTTKTTTQSEEWRKVVEAITNKPYVADDDMMGLEKLAKIADINKLREIARRKNIHITDNNSRLSILRDIYEDTNKQGFAGALSSSVEDTISKSISNKSVLYNIIDDVKEAVVDRADEILDIQKTILESPIVANDVVANQVMTTDSGERVVDVIQETAIKEIAVDTIRLAEEENRISRNDAETAVKELEESSTTTTTLSSPRKTTTTLKKIVSSKKTTREEIDEDDDHQQQQRKQRQPSGRIIQNKQELETLIQELREPKPQVSELARVQSRVFNLLGLLH